MRFLFFTTLIVVVILAFLNLEYIPSRQRKAREIIDRHLHSLPLTGISETSYVGKVSVLKNKAGVENIHIKAEYAKWNRLQYSDITLDIKSITYDSNSIFIRNVRNIETMGEISFSGVLSFDEITTSLALEYKDFVNPSLRVENGRLIMRTFVTSLNQKYDFEGDFILTPTGDLKFLIRDIFGVDISDPRKSTIKALTDEFSNLIIPIVIMDHRIALDEIQIENQSVRISGKTRPVQGN